MSKLSHGPKLKAQSSQLLGDLLRYANDELENCDISSLHCRWEHQENSNPKLIVESTLQAIATLSRLTRPENPLTANRVRDTLRQWQNFLGILEDHRTKPQGSSRWHFTLNLWSRHDIDTNITQIEALWEECKLRKSETAQTATESVAKHRPGVLHTLAYLQRWEFLEEVIPTLTPAIFALGGKEAVAGTAQAIREVCRQW